MCVRSRGGIAEREQWRASRGGSQIWGSGGFSGLSVQLAAIASVEDSHTREAGRWMWSDVVWGLVWCAGFNCGGSGSLSLGTRRGLTLSG